MVEPACHAQDPVDLVPQPLQGTASAEAQAAAAAGDAARGGTAYVNLETGDCHGDTAATAALLAAGVSRVVVGLPHPLSHLRGAAIGSLRAHGVDVEVLGVAHTAADPVTEQAALEACLSVNEVSHPALRRKAGSGVSCTCSRFASMHVMRCAVSLPEARSIVTHRHTGLSRLVVD